jgi:hypothetical protein
MGVLSAGAVGATAALFLGCSLLSAVEVAYFSTLRALCAVLRSRPRAVHSAQPELRRSTGKKKTLQDRNLL